VVSRREVRVIDEYLRARALLPAVDGQYPINPEPNAAIGGDAQVIRPLGDVYVPGKLHGPI
jgi:hypothetical protein